MDEESTYTCLSYDEANILLVNYRKQDHGGFIARLDDLMTHTSDPYLLRELESLLKKIKSLTPAEYKKLTYDIEAGALVFPADYVLPHIL